ncbi:protein MIZU-KUSSEI 1 [Malania oleifera]|uniref:protein MIZU-KUSSEI 1 n=1 Tax=Malania oleifera TaxID=397392 RepID=UPI0025AE425C|nr:protein MIZU-KUSSEI 1 [Malania oleifera]
MRTITMEAAGRHSHRASSRDLRIMDTPTSVDCAREVRFRRCFRTLVECMVPCCGLFPQSYSCGRASSASPADVAVANNSSSSSSVQTPTPNPPSIAATNSAVVTGTFFGYRKGRVSFCLQADTRSSPLLLLEFAVPTAHLAREMQHGLLRIALECSTTPPVPHPTFSNTHNYRGPLYGVPVWSIFCNGRKMGYAVRRQMTAGDATVLKLMQSVSVGAGVLPAVVGGVGGINNQSTEEVVELPPPEREGDALMYLRASFERVVGSPDSEAFHIINPVGSSAQELSIFLLRS